MKFGLPLPKTEQKLENLNKYVGSDCSYSRVVHFKYSAIILIVLEMVYILHNSFLYFFISFHNKAFSYLWQYFINIERFVFVILLSNLELMSFPMIWYSSNLHPDQFIFERFIYFTSRSKRKSKMHMLTNNYLCISFVFAIIISPIFCVQWYRFRLSVN